MAGAQRFHRGFLRREAPREARNRVPLPRTIGNLHVGEQPVQEAIAVALEYFPHTRDVRRIEPEADNAHLRSTA